MDKIDVKKDYEKMAKLCNEHYIQHIEKIKKEVYGYNARLDFIIDFKRVGFNNETYDAYCKFTNEIAFYYKELFDEQNDFTLNLVRNYMLCILSYIAFECPSSDYIFDSFIKIIKTSNKNKKDVKTTTIYLLFDMLSDLKRKKINDFTKNGLDFIFENYDADLTFVILDNCHTCIRYFLYKNKLDYICDDYLSKKVEATLRSVKRHLNYFLSKSKDQKSDSFRG